MTGPGDIRVPGYRDPLTVTAEDVRIAVAAVLVHHGGIDPYQALLLAGITAHRLRLDRTELVDPEVAA